MEGRASQQHFARELSPLTNEAEVAAVRDRLGVVVREEQRDRAEHEVHCRPAELLGLAQDEAGAQRLRDREREQPGHEGGADRHVLEGEVGLHHHHERGGVAALGDALTHLQRDDGMGGDEDGRHRSAEREQLQVQVRVAQEGPRARGSNVIGHRARKDEGILHGSGGKECCGRAQLSEEGDALAVKRLDDGCRGVPCCAGRRGGQVRRRHHQAAAESQEWAQRGQLCRQRKRCRRRHYEEERYRAHVDGPGLVPRSCVLASCLGGRFQRTTRHDETGVRSAQPVPASPRPPRAAHRPAAARAPCTTPGCRGNALGGDIPGASRLVTASRA
eukprot:scaffold17945_cov68-Phaeocystis_antarctica.AAC.2